MEIEIVHREAFDVLGVQERVIPAEADWGAIWGHFMAYHDMIRAAAVDKGYYGVFFATGQEGVADFVACMAVQGVSEAPEGLVLRHVPAQRYAAFHCVMRDPGVTWNYAYSEWLPASEYEVAQPHADFEYYPPGSESDDSPVVVYIPIREKSA
jgi:predicted transcriptional regulator YdeE